jgi:predicted dinucleotide-binding enzyme
MTPPDPIRTVGILGAGRVGAALAKLARDAGLEVTVAGSSDASGLARATQADMVILAIPFGKYRTLPADALAGKLVIDAMNYWWELDGVRPEFSDPRTSTSETVQAFLADSRLAKSFNHASVWELENLARPAGHPERRALAVASDNQDDLVRASDLVDAMGFDPVPAGPLANGVMFEPGTEAFGADASAAELRTMLNRFWTSQRGLVVARNRDKPPAEC